MRPYLALALVAFVWARTAAAATEADYAADSSTTGVVSGNDWVSGNLETAGDVDWLRVTLDPSQVYTFDVEETSPPLFGIDPQLRLVTASDSQIRIAQPESFGNAQIGNVTGLSGTYYLEVRDIDTGRGDDANDTGPYRVRLSSVPHDDYAGDTSTSGTISVPGTATDNIDFAGDHD